LAKTALGVSERVCVSKAGKFNEWTGVEPRSWRVSVVESVKGYMIVESVSEEKKKERGSERASERKRKVIWGKKPTMSHERH
jgi:hypothetical protein